jgi:hypothetical protein
MVIWEPNKSIIKKKLQRVIIAHTYFGLKADLDKM